MDRAETGRLGEQAACGYLRERGYLIRELNWRSGHDEIDIIAERFDQIRFVEVKTRRAGGLTAPEDALDSAKSRNMLRAASRYMALHAVSAEPHFDLAAVDAEPDGSFSVRYFEDAVTPHWRRPSRRRR